MLTFDLAQVKEEMESDPDFFREFSVSKSGGPAAPEAQAKPRTAAVA